jgi:glucose-1-phosphate thymidylyltransferase
MHVVVFEDRHVADLFPVTLGRPAYAILCGGYRLVDLIVRLDSAPCAVVREYLAEIQAADFPCFRPATAAAATGALWINARLVPSRRVYDTLRSMLGRAEPCVVRSRSSIAAAVLPAGVPLPPTVSCTSLDDLFRGPGVADLSEQHVDLPLLEHPHDIIRHNQRTLGDNLELRLTDGEYQEIAEGVFAAAGASLGAYAVTNTQSGPIVLERDVKIGPFAYVCGPAHLGAAARVLEHAAIKDGVSIGHTAKVGGEVEASVIEAYTNKQHHGFLGHSYLGSWINLGAGTCNSDLKNTYGNVNMTYGNQRVETGMQFVGCLMGDYTKTAINTGIFTGKVIGVCSMLYGFVTTNVPSFVNYARLFGQITELPPDVMVATQRRMFDRRNVAQRPCDVRLIHDMYARTAEDRRLGGDPLTL